MNSAIKITRKHLDKNAVVYVRQSSQEQVQNNLESQRRQYSLKERAVALGWPQERCIVIDEDLGISGAHSANRPGYQKLISKVALNEVGVIFGIEVSRLARNCLDWYQLLEVASTFGVLIGDEDAVYDPGDFNDRLLLGLKGTISEVELQQIKSRMYRGRMNKAKRGELYVPVPVGYERDLQGNIRLSADESVRDAIHLVFRLFANLGSIRALLKELVRRNQELPFSRRELKREVVRWRAPKYDQIYLILKNPFYAGIYAYGKRGVKYNPVERRYRYIVHDPKNWHVVIPDHHESYVSMEDFERNQKRLKENSFVDHSKTGAAREGSNLLQGILYCASCGRKMRSAYSKEKPGYVCTTDHIREGAPRCSYAGAKRVDQRVEDLLLNVLNDGTVDLTFEMLKTQKQELLEEKTQWQKKIKRLEYEEKLSRRRYESVDPENRLVASTLEKEWNKCMQARVEAETEFREKFLAPESPTVTALEVKAILKDLPGKWRSSQLAIRDKKEILRCVIQRVTVSRKTESLDLHVYWYGGHVTTLNVPKRLISNPAIFDKIKQLAGEKTDEEIAHILNAEELLSYRGNKWTPARVLSFRTINRIPSAFSRTVGLRLSDSPYITTPELAALLGVGKATVQTWIKYGLFDVRRGNANKFLVKADKELINELGGSLERHDTDVAVGELLARRGQSFADVITWARAKGHKILRVRHNKGHKFVIRKAQNHAS